MGGTAIQLLGIEQGNGTMLSQSYDISSIATDPVSWFVDDIQESKQIFAFDASVQLHEH